MKLVYYFVFDAFIKIITAVYCGYVLIWYYKLLLFEFLLAFIHVWVCLEKWNLLCVYLLSFEFIILCFDFDLQLVLKLYQTSSNFTNHSVFPLRNSQMTDHIYRFWNFFDLWQSRLLNLAPSWKINHQN